nr:uncharacterized protein LOC121121196 [Lepeophtheirus salmonis]
MDLYTFLYLLMLRISLSFGLDHAYKKLRFEEFCHGEKTVVTLGNRAGIFSLNVSHLSNDFSCHLELEVTKGFGFHVYIQEMDFQGSEHSSGGGCNQDYLQFARDVLFFTTHSSPKYCGVRPKLNYTLYPYLLSTKSGGSDLARMYIEKKDSEMDIWVKLSSEHSRGPRNLTLVVTPFKKKCPRSDSYYRMCSHSTHCIHKDYFCDEYVNCAWPGGDLATDEIFCRQGIYIGGSKDPYSSIGGDFTDYYNIPLIIVVIIMVLAALVAFAVGLRIFYRRFRKSDEINNEVVNDRHRVEELTELYDGGSPTPPPRTRLTNMPSAPPSYEDVVSNQVLMRNDQVVYDPPPIYTPT